MQNIMFGLMTFTEEYWIKKSVGGTLHVHSYVMLSLMTYIIDTILQASMGCIENYGN